MRRTILIGIPVLVLVLACVSNTQVPQGEKSKDESLHPQKIEHGTFTDNSGRIYKTVTLGGLEWMAENLDVSTFRNGDTILHIGLDGEPFSTYWRKRWDEAMSKKIPAWTYVIREEKAEFGADKAFEEPKYGKVYNIYAIMDKRGLAPEGWRISTDKDWKNLTDACPDKNYHQSEKTFTISNALWDKELFPKVCRKQPERIEFNGFNAMPSGRLENQIGYKAVGEGASFWVSIDDTVTVAELYCVNDDFLVRELVTMSSYATNQLKVHFSSVVRCVKE